MDCPAPMSPPLFLPRRFIEKPGFQQAYYAFGNTVAVDLLEHVPDTVESPSILQLGCGDMRSCLYTIWKNFDEHCGHGNFKGGVSFYLNDISVGVLARNLLFIYLILKLQEISTSEIEKRKKMICSIWNIWYCHDLSESQFTLLKESLVTLSERLASRSAWCESSNVLKHLVEFSNADTMQQVSLMFQKWLSMTEQHKARLKQQRWDDVAKKRCDYLREDYFRHCFELNRILSCLSKSNIPVQSETLWSESKADEVLSYVRTGNARAEKLFAIGDLPEVTKTFLNPTLYENDALYTLKCDTPFESYCNGFIMSKKNVKYPEGTILVEQDAFDTTPLHANSLQQFTVRVVSCANILSKAIDTAAAVKKNYSIKFMIDNSDCLITAIQLNHTHRSSFDTVDTSNLIDYVISLGLVICTVPLLKDNGVLLTTSMSYEKYGYKTAYDFIKKTSGLTLIEHLVFLGIRYLGHEGKYNGHGVLCPVSALQVNYINYSLCPFGRQRLMLWKKIINSTPFLFQALDENSLATKTLFEFFKFVLLSETYNFVNSSPQLKFSVTSHTAMNMILLFINQLSDRCPVGDFKFWAGLCSCLQHDKDLHPFLLHIQCQAIMMDIHMHLTVTEENCPICNGTELKKYFKKFSIIFSNCKMTEMCDFESQSAVVLTCLHPKLMDVKCLDLTHNNHSLPQDAFIFDSNYVMKIDDSSMKVDMLVPSDVLNVHEYAATMFFRNYVDTPKVNHIPVATVPLTSDLIVDDQPFAKHAPRHSLRSSPSLPLGQLESLEYIEEGQYKVQISLSAKALSALEQTKLTIQTVSDTEFKVVCGTDSFNIRFGLPVNYSQLKYKYFKKRLLIMIDVPCKPFNTYSQDQPPLFFSDPGNMVNYPILKMDDYTLQQAAESQMIEEKSQLSRLGQNGTDLPLIKVKKSVICLLFQQTKKVFFRIKKDKITCGLVAVHRRSFDVQNLTPALDISFYINVNGVHSTIVSQWDAIRRNYGKFGEVTIEVDESELLLLEKVFMAFHRRTRVSSKGINIHSLQAFNNLGKKFCRAVIYHLTTTATYDISLLRILGDKKKASSALSKTNPLCYHCKSEVVEVMKCSRCLVAIYCGKECQVKDWKTHKKSCVKAEATPTTNTITMKQQPEQLLPTCSYCKTKSNNLRKCTGCRKVAYCSKNCQTKDWNDHKSHCHLPNST